MPMDDFVFQVSVEQLPGFNASAAFVSSDVVFREKDRIVPRPIGSSGLSYFPWGADNLLPYRIIDRFEEDETLSVCHDLQAESCYASGLSYVWTDQDLPCPFSADVDRFFLDNNVPEYFLGICRDIKMFEFAVSVLILSEDGSRITNVFRKHAAYCRFAPPEADGFIPYVLYADWRSLPSDPSKVEVIPLLDSRRLRSHLSELAGRGDRKVAMVHRIPSVESMVYPIPVYGSLFKGKWYNIKRFIAIAKEAKLKNSAPIKYLVEISQEYWNNLWLAEHIVAPEKKLERAAEVKRELIDFLTGAENSGKAIFSNFRTTPDGRVSNDIKITKIDSATEGGDWSSDHAEAINMLCFAMRVHSNLVGSVPSKSANNNSGSDKRELYTIAQAMQKSYRDCILHLHRVVIDYNGWRGLSPVCPLIQLTTLDEHRDAKLSDV